MLQWVKEKAAHRITMLFVFVFVYDLRIHMYVYMYVESMLTFFFIVHYK
jgi:hypothetical protein